MPEQAASPKLNQLLLKFENGRFAMSFDRLVAVVACVATVVCMIIAILSYLN